MLEGETFRPTGIEEIVDAMINEYIGEMRILNENEYNTLCRLLVKESSRLPTSLSRLTSRLYSDKRL